MTYWSSLLKGIVVVVVVGGLITAAVFAVVKIVSDNTQIDLTKDEALRLQNLHFRAVMAAADRDQYVQELIAKYKVTMETHSLDASKGRFVKKEKATQENNTRKETK